MFYIIKKRYARERQNGNKDIDIQSGAEPADRTAQKINIRLFGSLGETAEKSRDEARLPDGLALPRLLAELADAYGERFRAELFEGPDRIRNDVTVSVNGTIIWHENAADITLNPGDEVALFPIFPGGG